MFKIDSQVAWIEDNQFFTGIVLQVLEPAYSYQKNAYFIENHLGQTYPIAEPDLIPSPIAKIEKALPLLRQEKKEWRERALEHHQIDYDLAEKDMRKHFHLTGKIEAYEEILDTLKGK